MNVNYVIKLIPNKGYGLISKQFIKKGSLIWSCKNDKNVISIDDNNLLKYLEKYNDEQMINILDHMYCFNGLCYDLSNSDNKYTNHSNNPNSYINENNESIALRDIYIDEEITENYTTYDNYLPNYYILMKKYYGTEWINDYKKWK